MVTKRKMNFFDQERLQRRVDSFVEITDFRRRPAAAIGKINGDAGSWSEFAVAGAKTIDDGHSSGAGVRVDFAGSESKTAIVDLPFAKTDVYWQSEDRSEGYGRNDQNAYLGA